MMYGELKLPSSKATSTSSPSSGMKNAPRCLPARGAATGAQALSSEDDELRKFQLDPALLLGIIQACDNRGNHAEIFFHGIQLTFPALRGAR